MRNYFLLILSSISLVSLNQANAQTTTFRFLDNNYDVVKEKKATRFQRIEWENNKKTACRAYTYTMDSVLLYDESYTNFDKELFKDTITKYREFGTKVYQYVYDKNNKKKSYTDFYFDGNIETREIYDAKGLGYSHIGYSRVTKKEPIQKVTDYGRANVQNDTLIEIIYSVKDSMISEKTFWKISQDKSLELFTYIQYKKGGQLYYQKYYHNNDEGYSQWDSLYSYYPTGELKRQEYTSRKHRKRNKCFSKNGETMEFTPMFTMADYPRGEDALMRWLGKNIEYPKIAKENGIEGVVYVEFVVCTDGELCEFEVAQGVHNSLDNAVLKTLKEMPRWKPGKVDGKNVRSSFTLPVSFITE